MTEAVEKKVEETKVEETKEESDDEAPALENAEAPAENVETPAGKSSKGEKKARKAMAKLGMKPFPGVEKVTMRRNKTSTFVISNPDVFVSGGTYVVYGEPKLDDISAAKEEELMKAFQAAAAANAEKVEGKAPEEEEADDDDDEEEEDLEGIDEKNVEIIQGQIAGISRKKAIKALKKNNNDVVNTIMELNQ
eukprot:TRINITY_DN419_c0_g1_i3.p1 TRINITY_DN419_c0_g1~~TRINITY_DN419_c0_g1_i3.p1  ORF type:complete len:211 (+),score=81.83 TRINITY_DN419_c0_g1_i3:55-633(+)